PLQFFILLTGVLVFLFFQFNEPPVLFNQNAIHQLRNGTLQDRTAEIEKEYSEIWNRRQLKYQESIASNEINVINETTKSYDDELEKRRNELLTIYKESHNGKEAKESDYVFLYYILNYLPHGIIGLLLCVIISAAMSSTSGEINALAATSIIDFYKRLGNPDIQAHRQLLMSKLLTFLWGILAILFALFAQMVENLIEAVNILGSLFYGTILGVFLLAFFFKRVTARSVFIAAITSQLSVFVLYLLFKNEIAYLWHNVIGCAGVIILAVLLSLTKKRK
ncbi:MAG TPA: sodium:solute symporter, partial [Flavobacteriales bacterium]|nr:sodium:solute symporter [Flavobacteriales bacterium]